MTAGASVRLTKANTLPQSVRRQNRKLSRRPLVRTDAAEMFKRRLKQAGLLAHHSPHSFRATGIAKVFGK
jgi:hypothetical protein